MNYCRFKDQQREEWMLLGPAHPADIFREEVFATLALTRKALASRLGLSVSTTSKFMNRRIRVSPRIAAGLAAVSPRSALYWLVVQAQYDAWRIELDQEEKADASNQRARRFAIPELA